MAFIRSAKVNHSLTYPSNSSHFELPWHCTSMERYFYGAVEWAEEYDINAIEDA